MIFIIGNILPYHVGLVICSGVHGFRSLHNARISQEKVWWKEDSNISISVGSFTLCVYKNICKCSQSCTRIHIIILNATIVINWIKHFIWYFVGWPICWSIIHYRSYQIEGWLRHLHRNSDFVSNCLHLHCCRRIDCRNLDRFCSNCFNDSRGFSCMRQM